MLKSVHPVDLPVREAASRLRISKSTALKYMAILKAEGKVECRVVDRAKLCRAKGEQIEE